MALDMFLEFPKTAELKGETKDSVYKDKNALDLLAWSWGMSNSGSAQVGGGAGAGKVNVQDISFTKYIDRSSPNFMLFCCNGKHIPSARLIVRKAGEKPLEYIIIEMEEILISSVSTGGSGGEDRLTENVSMNFAKVKVKYVPQKDDGTAAPEVPMGWDIAANIKI